VSPLLFLYQIYMAKQELEIKAFVTDLLQEREALFLVDIVFGGTNSRRKIQVILDKDSGILIDECGEFSRALGNLIEEKNIFGDAPYVLEVSSPGMDRPLTVKRQYQRRIGNTLNFLLNDGAQFEAVLKNVSEEGVLVEPVPAKNKKSKKEAPVELVTEPRKLRFEEIKKCNLIVSFK
jgi:ribosome maturation factor RimP